MAVTGFVGATPIRPLTRASFFINMYANRLTVGAQFDTACFSSADAEQFMDELADNLIQVSGTPMPRLLVA